MKTPMNVFNTAMKKKNKNRKGFSLVELIVCLVIMAILAAALVPTLIGYIKQTRQSNAKNEAAACVSAAQTVVSSAFADPDNYYQNQSTGARFQITDVTNTDANGKTISSTDFIAAVASLSEMQAADISNIKVKDGVVIGLTYDAGHDGKDVVTYAVTNGKGAYTMGTSSTPASTT